MFRLTSACSIGFALMLLFIPASLYAQGTLVIRTNYYRVAGSTPREIQRSLDQSRPRMGQHDGQTTWQITWQFNTANQDGNCRLTSFTTRTTITLTMPLWAMPTNTAPDVFKAWRDYCLALSEHEQGHVQLAKEAAAAIQQRAQTFTPRSDCSALKNEVNSVCRSIVETHRQQEKDYDERTRHGASQGAVLNFEREPQYKMTPRRRLE